jgi:hypothetical protein
VVISTRNWLPILGFSDLSIQEEGLLPYCQKKGIIEEKELSSGAQMNTVIIDIIEHISNPCRPSAKISYL